MKNSLLSILYILILTACSEDENISPFELISPTEITCDARCQMDTIRFSTIGVWKATTDVEWLTLVENEGKGRGEIHVYVQQNDAESMRKGVITITTDKGETLQVQLKQLLPDVNSTAIVDLPQTFGLGWGYDLSKDVADAAGLRGQVFDAVQLQKQCRPWNALLSTNLTSIKLNAAKGESHTNMQRQMSTQFTGKADIIVASAQVSVQYSKQINEKQDCYYFWCRDLRTVKHRYFSSAIDLYQPDIVKYCTTSEFRKAVKNDTPQAFVEKYGTHLVVSSTLGGKLDYYFTLSKSVTTEIEKLVTTINVKILFIKKQWQTVDENVWTTMKQSFQANYHVTGGGDAGEKLNMELQENASKGRPLSDTIYFHNWFARFENPNTVRDEDLAMVDFQVVPIWYIVEAINPDKADAIEDYVCNSYLNKEIIPEQK